MGVNIFRYESAGLLCAMRCHALWLKIALHCYLARDISPLSTHPTDPCGLYLPAYCVV